MIARIELTPDELCALISAVFAYNGHSVRRVIVAREGRPAEFDSVLVEYAFDGLRVRIAPDDVPAS